MGEATSSWPTRTKMCMHVLDICRFIGFVTGLMMWNYYGIVIHSILLKCSDMYIHTIKSGVPRLYTPGMLKGMNANVWMQMNECQYMKVCYICVYKNIALPHWSPMHVRRKHLETFARDIFNKKMIWIVSIPHVNTWLSINQPVGWCKCYHSIYHVKFVPKGPINNFATLVQIMAWRRPGDKPLSESMMVILLTHICIT